ncbi:MAG: PASTA domain-containing protein [Flavobacteriaceae bacterium]|jgi:eukaryotic-like serine/threonine-protein kinase|nr:PASTA domain-containing protein [Flavobacteriaceae bacterium]
MNFIKFLFSKSFVKQLILAFIVSVVFGFLALKWLKSYTNHGAFVTVPALTGKTFDAAQILINEHELRSEVQDSSNYNPNYPKGAVIEQDPLEGSQVKEGRKIYLILNPSAYRTVAVPDVIRRTFRQAKSSFEAVGFQIGTKTYKDDLGEDEVLQLRHNGQIIEAGTMLPKTSKIDLVLGNGVRK